MPRIVFLPSGRRGEVEPGTTVLAAARKLGADIDSVCGGRGICGRCQVEIATGRFEKHDIDSRAAHAGPSTPTEERYAARRGLCPGRRLACQARVEGDLVIDVPPESQVHRQLVRKEAEVRDIEIDPVLRLHYVEVEEPSMDRPRGDRERLLEALRRDWGLTEPVIDAAVLRTLQERLRGSGFRVTAAVHEGRRLIGLHSGFHDRALGLAVDIGSTTLAAHLCDLSTGLVLASGGRMNPQIRFGEDLMSRVSYAMMNPQGAPEMTDAVRRALDELIGELITGASADAGELLELVVVGNPVMHHLFLGLDPRPLGTAPFALGVSQAVELAAAELGLGSVPPSARVYLLPCIAGHVGADCAAVMLAEAPHRREELTLIVDVGTNAEILLGNRQRLLACSSPTGPALEGAQISCGQRAAPGAIERVRIDRATLEPRFRVIGCAPWSDEPGFEEAVAATGITGICGSGIVEVLAEMYLAGILTAEGSIDGGLAARSARLRAEGRTWSYVLWEGPPEIRVTQNDVRAVQLAKAALYAGSRLLMEHLGVDSVDRIRLAGAFGSQLDPFYAMVLGMIPDCPLERVSAAGNAAGTGARIALLNRAARREIEGVVHGVEKIETAIEPRFQEHFVEAMAIPHRSHPFPRLAEVVTLPEPRDARRTEVRSRRRRGGGKAQAHCTSDPKRLPRS